MVRKVLIRISSEKVEFKREEEDEQLFYCSLTQLQKPKTRQSKIQFDDCSTSATSEDQQKEANFSNILQLDESIEKQWTMHIVLSIDIQQSELLEPLKWWQGLASYASLEEHDSRAMDDNQSITPNMAKAHSREREGSSPCECWQLPLLIKLPEKQAKAFANLWQV